MIVPGHIHRARTYARLTAGLIARAAAEASCPVFIESIPDLGDPDRIPSALEPIEGTIELRP